jgi:AcrR family transcriptional regulator
VKQDAAAARGPGRPRSEASREAILSAAFELVSANGYENVTAQHIAEAAGAGKQTLYRWWESKADVVSDALAEHGKRAIDRVEERAIVEGDLEAFLRSTFRALKSSGPTLCHLMAEAQRSDTLRRALFERLIAPRRNTLRKLVGVKIKEPKAVEAVVTAVYGALWYRLLLREPLDAELARELSRVLGLAPARVTAAQGPLAGSRSRRRKSRPRRWGRPSCP